MNGDMNTWVYVAVWYSEDSVYPCNM